MIEEKMVKSQNGFYKKHSKYENDPIIGNKAYRSEEIVNSIVTVNGISFNADEISMDRIDRIVELANFQFNRAVAGGATVSDAFSQVYSREVGWKSADNVFHLVTVETLAEVQEQALINMEEKWQKYG